MSMPSCRIATVEKKESLFLKKKKAVVMPVVAWCLFVPVRGDGHAEVLLQVLAGFMV